MELLKSLLYILQFSEKPTDYVENSVTRRRNITLYIENFPVFSIDQILIHTGRDFYRVKEMIEKCLQSYSYLISKTYFSPHSDWFNSIKYYKTLSTEFFTSNTFHFSCFEHTFIPCISELSVINKERDEKEIPLHFQLCIGKHVVFAQNVI